MINISTNPSGIQLSTEAVESTFLKIISDLVGQSVSASETLESLRNIGIDSLGISQILCEVENELKISIPLEALEDENLNIAQLSAKICEYNKVKEE